MRVYWLLLGLLGFAYVPCKAAVQVKEIPIQFRGVWNADAGKCSATSESRLEIKGKTMVFYESSGPAVAIVAQGDSELAVILEMSGEGEQWLMFRHFFLSADRKTLTDEAGGVTRRRCPAV